VPTVNRSVFRIVVDLMLFGGVAFFIAAFVYFYWDIWTLRLAKTDAIPNFDSQLLYAAGLVAGILGTYFAVQLKAGDGSDQQFSLGGSLVHNKEELLGSVAFLAYFFVGAWSLVTIFFCRQQSPETIKVMASAFGGYFLTLFTGAFAGGSTAPEQRG
jgi:TRAP-type C4-dicarboxylate transport system permease small subunit